MSKLLPTIALLVLGYAPTATFGTAQIGEYLIYKGQRVEIYTTPLESYFSDENPRPEFPEGSTGCWRGYIGVWKIEKGTLYLLSLHEEDWDSKDDLGKKIPLDKMFANQKPPIPATWFSDVIRLPQGKILRYVHMGFGSIYEKEKYITVKKGKVVRERIVDNKGKGATQSRSDLMWVELGGGPVKDDGKWRDARLIGTAAFKKIEESGKEFTTRGIILGPQAGRPGGLWIPPTPTTQEQFIPLHFMQQSDDDRRIMAGSHVEIKAHFEKVGDKYLLKVPSVESVRELKPGETIHHPSFKPPNQRLQTDADKPRR